MFSRVLSGKLFKDIPGEAGSRTDFFQILKNDSD